MPEKSGDLLVRDCAEETSFTRFLRPHRRGKITGILGGRFFRDRSSVRPSADVFIVES
jgi:hypothetical protein